MTPTKLLLFLLLPCLLSSQSPLERGAWGGEQSDASVREEGDAVAASPDLWRIRRPLSRRVLPRIHVTPRALMVVTFERAAHVPPPRAVVTRDVPLLALATVSRPLLC